MLSRSEQNTEKRLLLALGRLERLETDGEKLTSEVLIKRLAARGRVAINYTTVALEAGLSPALIGTPESRYPRVRNAIRVHLKKRSSGRSKATDAKEEIRRLKARIAELEGDNRVLATRLVDAKAVARGLEARLEIEANRHRRIAARATQP